MTVSQLIELLEDYREQHGDDCEVRLMTQENWPFENNIRGVTSGAEMNEAGNEDEEEYDDQDVEADAMVYIVEGGQICYGSKRAWETARAS
jgi:hypothetical protein